MRSFAPKFTNKSSTLSVFGFIGLSSRDLSYFTRSSNKFVNVSPRVITEVKDLYRIHNEQKRLDEYQLDNSQLTQILEALSTSSFHFLPMYRLFVPKPFKPGELRPITIPHPRDLIIMDAISNVLTRLFHPIFLECSHGFRKGRGTRTCFFTILSWPNIDHFITADVVGCFDNIHHDLLLTILSSFINDSRFINLISAFIKTDILDKTEKNYAGDLKGIPQGSSLSPVLMSIYMHQFDVELSHFISRYPDIHYVRYADDLLIGVSGTEPGANNSVVDQLNTFISHLQLELKISLKKNGESFLFLGILIKANSGGTITLIAPLTRIDRKIQRMPLKEKPYAHPLVLGDHKFEEPIRSIISMYNHKIITYLALYCPCSNALQLKKLLKKRMRDMCITHLAQFTKTSKGTIKGKYGSQLERSPIPFLSHRKIDEIFKKQRLKYESQKTYLLEVLDSDKTRVPFPSVIRLQLIVSLLAFALLSWLGTWV